MEENQPSSYSKSIFQQTSSEIENVWIPYQPNYLSACFYYLQFLQLHGETVSILQKGNLKMPQCKLIQSNLSNKLFLIMNHIHKFHKIILRMKQQNSRFRLKVTFLFSKQLSFLSSLISIKKIKQSQNVDVDAKAGDIEEKININIIPRQETIQLTSVTQILPVFYIITYNYKQLNLKTPFKTLY